MHDIRKPYTRSSSSGGDLQSRVEQFESRSYERDSEDVEENYREEPVRIPTRRIRRDIHSMDMYPRRRSTDVYEEDIPDEGYDRERPRQTPRPGRFSRYGRQGNPLGTIIFILVVVVLAAGAGLYTYVFDKATITIVPKYQDINDFHETILFTKDSKNTTGIPFIVASSSITKSKTLSLSESRMVEAKASGKITIYNNYNSSPQKLIKNTRFESAAGKIYRINQSITVPGKNGSTPGSLDVTVYADSTGADYNSAPTTFTIPGFKGTAREEGFYARSKGAITGGSSGKLSLVSLSDLNAAKDELALELAQEVKADLMKINKDGYIGLYGAIEIQYADNQTDVLNGVTSVYQTTATGYLMLADARKLAQSVAHDLRDYNNEPVRLGYTDTMTYTRKDIDDITANTELSILVEGKPRVVWTNDIDQIKDMVRGKKRSDFKPLMKTIGTIESADLGLSPVWLSSFPTDTGKIIVIESLPKR